MLADTIRDAARILGRRVLKYESGGNDRDQHIVLLFLQPQDGRPDADVVNLNTYFRDCTEAVEISVRDADFASRSAYVGKWLTTITFSEDVRVVRLEPFAYDERGQVTRPARAVLESR